MVPAAVTFSNFAATRAGCCVLTTPDAAGGVARAFGRDGLLMRKAEEMTPPVDDPAEPGKLLQEDSGGFWSHEHAAKEDNAEHAQNHKPRPACGDDRTCHCSSRCFPENLPSL